MNIRSSKALAACLAVQLLQEIGKMKGQIRTSTKGRFYMAYEGIRYANIPRNLEYSIAVKENVNIGKRIDCIESRPKDGILIGETDCLFLNVFAPMPFRNKSMPVLVWIHGNGFRLGMSQSSMYEPKRHMDHDMIVVTMSYRVGPLGFASLEAGNFLGNFGFNDQEMAIEWVRKNIALFGGDPSRITLAGQGAGAVYVLHHLNGHLSSKVYRGIALGGSRYANWATSIESRVATRTAKLALALQCRFNNRDCIGRESAQDILTADYNLQSYTGSWWKRLQMPYTPIPNREDIVNPWLVRSPGKKFSLLIGLNRDEGSIMKAYYSLFVTSGPSQMIDWMSDVKAGQKSLLYDVIPGNHIRNDTAIGELLKLYNKTRMHVDFISKLTTDAWFIVPAMVEAKWHGGTVQAVMFNYKSDLDHFACLVPKSCSEVIHGDELPFIFVMNGCKHMTEDYERVAAKYTNIIANFVHGRDLDMKSNAVDKELFNLTQAIYDPEAFAEIDKELSERLTLWKSVIGL